MAAHADGDVAEVRDAFDGISVETLHRTEIGAMTQHAHAVPELQHQVVVRQQIGIASAHVGVAVLEAARNLQPPERHAHHAAPGRVDTDVVERGPVSRDLAGGRFADEVARVLDSGWIRSDDQEHVVRPENRGRRWYAVLLPFANGDHLDAHGELLLELL
jgi:hypothetical protein